MSRILVPALAASWVFAVAGWAFAEDAPFTARTAPTKALQTALKNLQKSGGYEAGVSIEGGLSDKEDHEVTETTVREEYQGVVHGSLMHVASAKAYRLPRKGVAYIDGAWRQILSDPKTTLLDRLFTFPEVLLDRALSHAPASGRWLTPEEEKARGYASEDEDDEEEEEDDEDEEDSEAEKASGSKKPTGKTTVAKPAKGTKGTPGAEGPPARVLRVEAPPKEALLHFTEVQNSGCMSGG